MSGSWVDVVAAEEVHCIADVGVCSEGCIHEEADDGPVFSLVGWLVAVIWSDLKGYMAVKWSIHTVCICHTEPPQ